MSASINNTNNAQCKARTKRSGKQCKNKMIENSHYCSLHDQGKTTITHHQEEEDNNYDNNNNSLPLCRGKTKSGHSCQHRVSLKNERYCPAHGGLTKNGIHQTPQRVSIPYHEIAQGTMHFLMMEHPRCRCDVLKPCMGYQLCQWLHKLSTLTKGSGYPSPTKMKLWLSDCPNNNGGLMDAVESILGASCVKWMEALLKEDDSEEFSSSSEKDSEEDSEEEEDDDEPFILEKDVSPSPPPRPKRTRLRVIEANNDDEEDAPVHRSPNKRALVENGVATMDIRE